VLPAELIERKRDGTLLEERELREFLDGYLAGEVADYQMSAFLMAVYFRGLRESELATLTTAIVESGRRLDFRDGEAPAVDKHSTGGVGDKVSLVLSPLVATAGLRIPMMSGRGLGHTGGTLDKLESIPGFRTALDLDEFRELVAAIGCAMIGQTDEITPLDGRLYALRDVTGTVQSIPLIASSIVSKKVAEGVESLVLDVKCGRGAFMREEEAALELAETLVGLSGRMGLPATALVTGMESPLGRAVGNALEVREAIECLRGGGPADLRMVTLALAGELLVSTGRSPDPSAAREELADLLDGGAAAERFRRLVERQGGDPRVVEDPDRLPAAPVVRECEAEREGWIAGIDARRVGLAAVELGAGRARMEDRVDPAVGFEVEARPGDRVDVGRPLARVHARDGEAARRAAIRFRDAVAWSDEPPSGPAVEWERRRVRHRVTAEGIAPAPETRESAS